MTSRPDMSCILSSDLTCQCRGDSELDGALHLPQHEERRHVSVPELLRYPAVRYRTLNLWFNWTANVLVYYGLLFLFVDVGGDMYLSTLLGGAVEVPAYLFSVGVGLLLGRRLPIAGTMLLTGGCLLATIAVPTGRRNNPHNPHCLTG